MDDVPFSKLIQVPATSQSLGESEKFDISSREAMAEEFDNAPGLAGTAEVKFSR